MSTSQFDVSMTPLPQSFDRWHPIGLGLPSTEEVVQIAYLVCGRPSVWVGFHDGRIWRFIDAMPLPPTHAVTFWRPLAPYPGSES